MLPGCLMSLEHEARRGADSQKWKAVCRKSIPVPAQRNVTMVTGLKFVQAKGQNKGGFTGFSGRRYCRARYSYRKASAGRMRAADQEGYTVAINEMPTATNATRRPSSARGAKGT